MPSKEKKPRKPSLKNKLLAELNADIKKARLRLRELERDKKSLSSSRSRKQKLRSLIATLNNAPS